MAGSYGELVLVIGDMHLHTRANDLPAKFRDLLIPGKLHYILSTGNLCSKQEFENWKTIVPPQNVHVVKGDFDEMSFPDEKVVQIGQFRIGLIHGHQVVPWGDPESLAAVQRRLDVDILVTGHTHKNEVYQYENKYIINPGSATGAYSPTEKNVIPSFVLMVVKGSELITYVYKMIDGEVSVTRSDFSKTDS